MIRSAWNYFAIETWPRRRDILTGTEFLIAVCVGASTVVWGPKVALAYAKTGDIIGDVLTYAAIGFGFCLAGLTLSLTFPDKDFARILATTKIDNRSDELSNYSDLVFVFSWTALAHWVLVLACLTLLIARGPDQLVFPAPSTLNRRVAMGGFGFLVAYALLQFVATLFALSEIADVYISYLRSER